MISMYNFSLNLILLLFSCRLTDDVARENWEKYGNPDGPGVTEFGIALPVWLVQGNNSIWVLGLYGIVFMIILPTVVVRIATPPFKFRIASFSLEDVQYHCCVCFSRVFGGIDPSDTPAMLS